MRRRLIELGDSWHAPFGKLERSPPAHDANPLVGRRALGLARDHFQALLQGNHAVPAKLKIEEQRAAYGVQMRIVEAGDHPVAARIDNSSVFAAETRHFRLIAHRKKLLAFDGQSACVFSVIR